MWAVVALAGELGSFIPSSMQAVLTRVDSILGVEGMGMSSRVTGGAVWDLTMAAPAESAAVASSGPEVRPVSCLRYRCT